MKCVRVVAAVVERDGRYLITQRRPEAALPGYWEFPGGRLEADETAEAALAREFQHRLGVGIVCGERVGEVEHLYPNYGLRLVLYACQIVSGEPRAAAVAALAWAPSSKFGEYSFTPADEASIAALLGMEDKLS